MVRDGLDALISRAVFYDLVEIAEMRGTGRIRPMCWAFGAVVNFSKSDLLAMPDDHILNGNDAAGLRRHIFGAFDGPGIEPPSLDDGDTKHMAGCRRTRT
jgi:hypothetical protein